MRLGVVAIACAVLVGGGAAWTLGSSTSSTIASSISHHPTQARTADKLPAGASEGRIFLNKAQLGEALASDTVDRPIKSLLTVRSPLHFGDYSWNDRGIPNGPTWIRVDLRSQLISVFRAGHEIGAAVIVYGGDNKETPAGKLRILGKDRDHRSSLYDAVMPYTLRLTDDGVSIHGSSVRWGAATHGCIGVPIAFAQRLFDATKVGDEVIVIPLVAGASQRRSSYARR